MTDLVVISLEAWDGVWRRNQHLVSRLLAAAPSLRVLFVEPPADPIHDVRNRRAPRLGHAARERSDVIPGLWTLRPTKPLPRRLDRHVDERIAKTVQRAAARLGMTNPVLWINDPAAADVMRLTGWPTLYDITDDWASAVRPARERGRILRGEQLLLTHAAQVVACSPELVRRKQPRRPDTMAPLVLIRNAVDAAVYRDPHPRPADLPTGVVALYVGTLHSDRLDIDLCVRTARELAGRATVVFVGPNALADTDTRRLRESGAVILGARPHGDIPAYLQHADVLLVPHLVDDFTDSLDPIKLYEYLAAGRPIVSTPVAGFRDADDPRVQVKSPRMFPAAVVDAAGRKDGMTSWHSRSQNVRARIPTWDDRAETIRSVIERMST